MNNIMAKLKFSTLIISVIFTAFTFQVQAGDQKSVLSKDKMITDLLEIQKQWAVVNYQDKDDKQEDGFEQLMGKVDLLARQYPESAEPKVWQGIIRSTYAGAIGGLSALSNVKDAKAYLLEAKKIDDTAMAGSIYTSLGTLYAKVPGWPIAFGDDDKARELLSRGLEINPDGLDSNFFYADFLYEEGEYVKAAKHLNIALLAPKREHRALADSQRRAEAVRLLEKVKQEI